MIELVGTSSFSKESGKVEFKLKVLFERPRVILRLG